MKRKKLRTALMSALIALGGTSLAVGALVSCGDRGDTTTEQYTVTYEASDDYTISIASGTTYNAGDSVSFTVTVANGKTLTGVTVNGTSLGTGGSYTFEMPNSDVVIEVTVEDAYTLVATLSGSQYVGETLTASARVNSTSTTAFTMSASSGGSLVSIDNDAKTVELLAEGEATILFTVVYEGVTLTDSVTVNIVDTSIDAEDPLFTMDVANATNLANDVDASSSTVYKQSGTDIRDTYDGVTIMYTTTSSIGIAYSGYGGYGEIGTYQTPSYSTGEYVIESYGGLSVTSIVIDFYNTYSTFDNFLTMTVGDVTVSTPTLLSSEATGVNYTNSSGSTYEINKFTYQYYFGENAQGYLSISGGSYAAYFNNIRVYGEEYDMGDVQISSFSISSTASEIFVDGTATLSYALEPRRGSGTVSYAITSGEEYVSINDNVVTGVALGSATITGTLTTDSSTYTDTVTVTVVDFSTITVTPISDINAVDTQYTIRGVVVGKNSRNAIVHDGTGGIIVYGEDYVSSLSLGDYVLVIGTTTTYSNAYEMDENISIYKLDSNDVPFDYTQVSATELTTSLLSDLNYGSGTVPTTAIQKYSWTATVTQSGNYDVFTMEGASYTMESPYGGIDSDLSITYGSTYNLEGYYIGYYGSYVYFIVTDAELVSGSSDPTDPDPTDPTLEQLYSGLETISVSELLTKTADVNFASGYSSSTVYKVQGIVTQITSSSSGRYYLVDESTGDELYMYYSSDTYTGFSYSDGTYTYNHAGNFQDTEGWYSKLEAGDKITVIVMYGYYGSTIQGVGEIYSLDVERENNTVYKIDSELPSYISASKTSGIYYGEEITLEVISESLPTGEVVDTITHNGRTLYAGSDGRYTFTASVKNNVVVTTRSSDLTIYTVSITATGLGLGTSYGSSTTDVTIDDISFAYKDLMRVSSTGEIQTNYSTGSTSRRSELWNTSSTGYTIRSITLNAGSTWTSTANPVFQVSFGTSAITDGSSVSSYQEATYSNNYITSDVEGATFFNIIRAGSSAAYLESIVITLIDDTNA